jgi:hypothetical protein
LGIDEIKKGELGYLVLDKFIKINTLLDQKLDLKDEKQVEFRIYPSENTVKLFEKNFEVVGFKIPMVVRPNE